MEFSANTPGAVPEVPDGSRLRPGRVFPGMRERRNFRITKKLVHEHGTTENCPGCRFAIGNAPRGVGSNPMHTPECRQRFEDVMAATEDGRRRLRARDVRHGLAEEEEEEREEQAGEKKQRLDRSMKSKGMTTAMIKMSPMQILSPRKVVE